MATPQSATSYATTTYNSHFGSILLLAAVLFLIWLNKTARLTAIKSLFVNGPPKPVSSTPGTVDTPPPGSAK